MLFSLKSWLDQRQTIRRQKETIQCLTETLMAQPEIVHYGRVLFLRTKGGWVMFNEVGVTPDLPGRENAHSDG